jgi:hypothetical protein
MERHITGMTEAVQALVTWMLVITRQTKSLSDITITNMQATNMDWVVRVVPCRSTSYPILCHISAEDITLAEELQFYGAAHMPSISGTQPSLNTGYRAWR